MGKVFIFYAYIIYFAEKIVRVFDMWIANGT